MIKITMTITLICFNILMLNTPDKNACPIRIQTELLKRIMNETKFLFSLTVSI